MSKGGPQHGKDPGQARWERLLGGNPAIDKSAPTPFKRLWDATGTGWATVLTVALLVFVVSRWENVLSPVWPSNAPTYSSGAPDTALACVIRRGTTLAVVAPDAMLPGDKQLGVAYYAFRSRGIDNGIGAVEREIQGVVFSGSGIDPKDYPAVRTLYMTHLGTLPNPYWATVANSLSVGDTHKHVVRTGPMAYLFLVVASMAVFVRSLAWVRPLVIRLLNKADTAILTPEERRWKKLHERECPDCGYSLTGLAENRCPECGGKWTSTELTAWARRLQTR